MTQEKKSLRILVIDDEKAIRQFLRLSLSSHGYNVFEAAGAEEALEKSVSTHPDIIILDLGLPDIDGIEVLKRIRKRSKIPVIILSVRESPTDKICALDNGADDYLIKPFATGELLARIRALMRRLLPPQTKEVFNVGKLSMDILSRRVTVDGKDADLTPTEYDILKLLILNAGKVMTHQHILQEIWNKTKDLEGVLHLLRVTISNLRSKIEANPDRPEYILTEPGIGYRLHSEE